MTLQEKIAAILDQPVFGGELYYIRRPDPDGSAVSVSTAFGVFSIVGGQSFQNLEGDIDTTRPRIQISIFTPDALELIAKVAAVKAAMKAASELTETADPDIEPLALYNNSASVPVDGYDPTTDTFYSHCDYYAWSNQ